MKPLNLGLLSCLLSRPWAIRRETLASYTQAILSPGEFTAAAVNSRPRADTSFEVTQWNEDFTDVVRKPLPTKAGYTMFNWEGVAIERRGNLPDVPPGVQTFLIWGALGRAWSSFDLWWFDAIEVDEIVNQLAKAPVGTTVVFWFRSPGGIVTGIPETAAEILRIKKARGLRLIAFCDDMVASAAYWLAAMCDEIVATPTADAGSIGVYLAYYDFCAYLEKMGVKLELFKEGTLKGTGLIGNPLDEAARVYLQAGVTEAYGHFTEAVTAMRKVEPGSMQGQTFRGQDAMDANLVDRFVMSSADFFARLA